jgi:hypothetical protein
MSVIVQIPGGTALLYEQHELTQRRRQPLIELGLQSQALMDQVSNAQTVTGPDGQTTSSPNLSGPAMHLTAQDAHVLAQVQTAITWAYLRSWDLKDEQGNPIPLPKTVDDVLDMPVDVYDALSEAAAKQSTKDNRFELGDATVHDHTSPTGASDRSETH